MFLVLPVQAGGRAQVSNDARSSVFLTQGQVMGSILRDDGEGDGGFLIVNKRGEEVERRVAEVE